MAYSDPVLIDKVVCGEIYIGPAEGLLERVPLESGNYMVLYVRQREGGV